MIVMRLGTALTASGIIGFFLLEAWVMGLFAVASRFFSSHWVSWASSGLGSSFVAVHRRRARKSDPRRSTLVTLYWFTL